MKINKLFHWLYAFLMIVPTLLFVVNFTGYSLSMSGFESLTAENVFGWFVFPTYTTGAYSVIYGVYNYLLVNVFSISSSDLYISNFICNCFTYWTFMSICYLVFDLFMYIPLLVHKWIDKADLS